MTGAYVGVEGVLPGAGMGTYLADIVPYPEPHRVWLPDKPLLGFCAAYLGFYSTGKVAHRGESAMMAEPCYKILTNMSSSQSNTQLDGNIMTTLADPGTSTGTCDIVTDGQVTTPDEHTVMNVGQFETVNTEDLTDATARDATMVVDVDPLTCSMAASVSASETVQSESTALPASTVPVSPTTLDFMSATDATPTATRRGREGGETEIGTGDITEGAGTARLRTRGKRIAGRKLAVVDDDSESPTSMSIASAEDDDSKAASSSSRPKRKGVKRGREIERDKSQRKEERMEEKGSEERRKRRAKESGRKVAQDEEDAVGECGEPRGVVEHAFEAMSSSVLGGAILEWANKIDEIRLKSRNFQGKLNGEMKQCVGKIKEGTALLVIRSEATGDPEFLRMRNSELVARLREMEGENARLKEQLKKVSPLPSPPRKRRMEKAVEAANVAAKAAPDVPIPLAETRRAPPSIREAFPPLPQRPPRNPMPRKGDDWPPALSRAPPSTAVYDTEDSGTGTEAFFNQRIKVLVAARDLEISRKLREQRGRERAGVWDERTARERVGEDKGKDGTRKTGLRIVDNVQVVPSFRDRLKEETTTPGISGPEPEWRVATGGRRGRRNRYDGLPPPPPPFLPPPLPSRSDPWVAVRDEDTRILDVRGEWRPPPPPRQQLKIRPPRPPVSSAVAITGKAEGFSYASALKSARERIDLETLGIKTSRIRKAVNGGLLIEVTGEGSKAKAEELVIRLRDVLKDSAAVSCPVKKREVRVVGFDESVTTGEISEALSNLGGCSLADVKVGSIRTMTNGLGVVWAQLPVAAAAKVIEEERVRIGWTVARVELLKVRPLQCYRCWMFGHVQNTCHSVVDRRGACFKCGQHGHMANGCGNPAHCAVCHDAGLEASHRLGGLQCASQVRQDVLPAGRRP